MDSKYAEKTMAIFRAEVLMPAIEKAMEDGRIPDDLVASLTEAIRISRSHGQARIYGQAMMTDVCLMMLLNLLPKPKPKPKKK